MLLPIIGFQVEIKEKQHKEWDNGTTNYFHKSM